MAAGPGQAWNRGVAPSVVFDDTSPEVCPSGEERRASRSSPAPQSAGEVSPQVTEGAWPLPLSRRSYSRFSL